MEQPTIQKVSLEDFATTPNSFDLAALKLGDRDEWKTMPPKAAVKPIFSMAKWWLDYDGAAGIEGVDKELITLTVDGKFHHYAKDVTDEYGTWNIFADYGPIENNFIYLSLKTKVTDDKSSQYIVGKIQSAFSRPPMKDRFPAIDEVDLKWCERLKIMLVELSKGRNEKEILEEWENNKVE